MRLFRLLHHWFVPHEANNHRAKALHHEALLAYVLLLAVFNLGVRVFHGKMPDVLGYATDIRVEQLIAATNAKRAEAGLQPVTLNGSLSQAAAAKASDMFANNYWSHNSPSGKTPWDFIIGAGYRYTLAGENLAKNFQTSDGVVQAWMSSPTHKENIVKSGYKEVGFAVVNGVLNGEETTLVVQMFGTTTSAPVAQIPRAVAAEPSPAVTPIPTVSPAPTAVPAPETEDVVKVTTEVPAEPAAADTTPAPAPPVPAFGSAFAFERVVTAPKVDIATLTGNVAMVVVGLLIGLLAVDAFVVKKRRIVRIAGHNIAHILFLVSMVISGLGIVRGSLL